jgi:hypothetical protein
VADPINDYDAVNKIYLETNYYNKTDIDTKFDEIEKNNEKRLALSSALSGLTNDFSNGNKSLSVGTGYTGSEVAIGVKYGYKTKENAVFSVGMATTGTKSVANASFSMSW